MAAASPLRPPTTAHEIRSVAVRACRDPRTVIAAYEGRAQDMAVASIAAAAAELGFAPPPAKAKKDAA